MNGPKVRRVLAVVGADDEDDQSVDEADPMEAMCAKIEAQVSGSNCCLQVLL